MYRQSKVENITIIYEGVLKEVKENVKLSCKGSNNGGNSTTSLEVLSGKLLD